MTLRIRKTATDLEKVIRKYERVREIPFDHNSIINGLDNNVEILRHRKVIGAKRARTLGNRVTRLAARFDDLRKCNSKTLYDILT